MSVNYNPRQQQTYQNRYQRTGASMIGRLFTAGPYIVAFLSWIIATISLLALSVMDTITGYLTIGNMSQSDVYGALISLGTTGLLIALFGAGIYAYKNEWNFSITALIFGISIIPMLLDMYFDAMSADIIRYKMFVIVKDLPIADQIPQYALRTMMAILSFVGEPLAAMSVIIFPVLREIFNSVLGGDS